MAALVTANLASGRFAGRFALSSSGSVFLMARLLEDGTALGYLEQACPQQRFAVCAYLDELGSYRPTTISFPGGRSAEITLSTYFLWKGPLDKLGGFRTEQAEASAIVAGTLSTYPLAEFHAAVNNGWHQLFRFRTGDGLCAFPEAEGVSVVIRNVFSPIVYDRYRQSKQIRGVFGFNWFNLFNRIHAAIVAVSSLVLIGVLVVRGFRNPRALFATIFTIILVVGNAFTLGVLSGPFDRFQSRVIWLVPLLACCWTLAPRAQVTLGKV
jgi:hypothetical protein